MMKPRRPSEVSSIARFACSGEAFSNCSEMRAATLVVMKEAIPCSEKRCIFRGKSHRKTPKTGNCRVGCVYRYNPRRRPTTEKRCPNRMGCLHSRPHRRRDLNALPKAHLHIHFGAAMVTRELMEQLAKDFDKERFVKKARDYADSIKESNPKRAEKFYRRADKLATPDPIQAFFGPRTLEPNASENDILREVKRLDSLKEFPKIWDRQYCASYMIESGGEDALRRYMKTMYVDAVKENIVWIEAAAPALRLDEDGKEVDDSRYKMILKVWRELEKEYKGKVSLRFILPHPKSPAEAKTVLAWIKALGDDDAISIVGFGAWGSEDSAAESKEVFEMLRDAGYPIICHHAGEYLSKGDEEKRSTGNMWASLRFAKAERIGHGICAVTDEKLIAELKEKGVCLEVCPLSNRMLTYIPNGLRSHPLRKLFDAGIPCTLGSDDPGFFGTSVNAHSLNREYLIVRHFLGFTDKQLATLARNSITYSKAPAKLKERALAQIDVWLDGGC